MNEEEDQAKQDEVDKVAACVISGVESFMASPHLGPPSVAYADVMLHRVLQARVQNVEVGECAKDHLRGCLLHFELLRALGFAPRLPPPSHEGALEDVVESVAASAVGDNEDARKSLWQALDQVVAESSAGKVRGRRGLMIAGRSSVSTISGVLSPLASETEGASRSAGHGAQEGEAAMREFWDKYRTGTAKTTEPIVAQARAVGGWRLATTGVCPSIAQRIAEEGSSMDAPRAPALGSVVGAEQWGFAAAPARSGLGPSASGNCGGSVSFSNGQPPATPGTPSHARVRASTRGSSRGSSGNAGRGSSRQQSRGGQNTVSRKKSSQSALKHGSKTDGGSQKLPSIVPPVPLHKLSQGANLGTLSTFRSYDDYCSRKRVLIGLETNSRMKADAVEVLKMSSQEPQSRQSVPVVEHRMAAQWRHREVAVASAVGSAGAAEVEVQEKEPGALTERSRRMHLPEVSQRRGNLTERAVASIPPSAFRRPWSREAIDQRAPQQGVGVVGGGVGKQQPCSAVDRYAKVCRNTGVHPQPASVRFLVKLPPRLAIRAAGYADEDVLTLTAALPQDGSLKLAYVDLGENPRLGDEAVCGVLRALATWHSESLVELRFDKCRRLGKASIALCTRVLKSRAGPMALHGLQTLDLSGIPIPLPEYFDLARAVSRHPQMRNLRLADTGLGHFDKAHACRVLKVLAGSSSSLESLELAWNVFDAEAFTVLGQCLHQGSRLTRLGLASTGPTPDQALGSSPVVLLLEHLAENRSLEHLDISQNNLDWGSALMLESSVQHHPQLRHIAISSNPLGASGIRILMRLLALPSCERLARIECTDCLRGRGGDASSRPFDVDPSGHYSLDLSQPAPRAVLRLLLKRCVMDAGAAVPLSKVMRNAMITRSGCAEAPFNLSLLKPPSREDGTWDVPTCGLLSFDLSAGEVLLGTEPADPAQPFARVKDMMHLRKIRVGNRRRSLSVFGEVKRLVEECEWKAFLQALSMDFLLEPEEVLGLCITDIRSPPSCGKDPAGTCAVLLPCLEDTRQLRKVMSGLRGLADLQLSHAVGMELLSLNLENPTNHYRLKLDDLGDRCVAQQLMLLNRWEARAWQAFGHPDISERGDGKNFRNVTLDSQRFVWSSEEWGIPNEGTLEFDYVSTRRPDAAVSPVEQATWDRVLSAVRRAYLSSRPENVDDHELASDQLQEQLSSAVGVNTAVGAAEVVGMGTLREEDLLWAIRATSPRIFLTCRQIRELMCIFSNQESRVSVVVTLFLRCVNWPVNSNLCRALLLQSSRGQLRKRIGFVNAFPFIQPENYSAVLDLSFNDQRLVLNFLVNLNLQECPGNIRTPRLCTAQGWDTFPNGIPLSWAAFESIPQTGTFEATYSCSKDDIKLKVRRKLAASVGGWTSLPEEPAELTPMVRLCTVPDEVPEEAVRFVDFLVVTFKSLGHAFEKIDASKDGQLSLPEFVTGSQKAGFRLVRGKNPGSFAASEDGSASSKMGTKTSGFMEVPGSQASSRGPTSSKGFNDDAKSKSSASSAQRLAKSVSVLTAVYRWLDPNGDGMSINEFNALDGLWAGIRETMWDFVEHLTWRCGSVEAAWAIADPDDTGALSSSQFRAFAQRIDFDRPVDQVYMLLDDDDSDSVSAEEWQRLATITRPEGD